MVCSFMSIKYVPVKKILVLIASVSSKSSGKFMDMPRLARAFIACIHKVWMQIKVHTKIYTSVLVGYFNYYQTKSKNK